MQRDARYQDAIDEHNERVRKLVEEHGDEEKHGREETRDPVAQPGSFGPDLGEYPLLPIWRSRARLNLELGRQNFLLSRFRVDVRCFGDLP
jgi:hypothetical protein